MASEPLLSSTEHAPGGAEPAWDEIEQLIDEIATLAKSDLAPSEFYAQLLDCSVRALAATGGAIWLRGGDGVLSLDCQINLAETRLADDWVSQSRHARLLDLARRDNQPRLVPPHATAGSEQSGIEQAANPTRFLLILCPLVVERETLGVIELFQRPDTSPAAQRGYTQFLAAVCELAGDYVRNDQLRRFRQREQLWAQLDQFAQRVHGSLDLDITAYRIANEGRWLIGCDRVGVAIRTGSRCALRAISGVDTFDRRANAVRRIEELAAAVIAAGEPLWYWDQAINLPPQLESPLGAYLDESHVRLLAVVPLVARGGDAGLFHAPGSRPDDGGRLVDVERSGAQPIGALIVERFESGPHDGLRERVAAVSGHSAAALSAAQQVSGVPMLGLLRALGRARWLIAARQLPKTMLALVVLAAAVAALALIPADFAIEARGALEPRVRRDLFAPIDAEVSAIRVRHGSMVRAGEELLLLRSSKLALEYATVAGQLRTEQVKLDAVESARLGGSLRRDDKRNETNGLDLAAEAGILEKSVLSLEEQLEILAAQRKALSIKSPLAGEVLTWDVTQLLENRPVRQGDALLTVADGSGEWILELDVPDDRVGHVLDAQRSGEKLEVSFVLATAPDVTYQGRVEKVAMATVAGEGEQATVRVTVAVDRDALPRLRPGAGVVAKVHCGSRSIGYVWFHDLVDSVRSWFWF